jgi:hypothetical protein
VVLRTTLVLVDDVADTPGRILIGWLLPGIATAPASVIVLWLLPDLVWNSFWAVVMLGGFINCALVEYWAARRARPT